jgi:hypothetical protein
MKERVRRGLHYLFTLHMLVSPVMFSVQILERRIQNTFISVLFETIGLTLFLFRVSSTVGTQRYKQSDNFRIVTLCPNSPSYHLVAHVCRPVLYVKFI